MATCQGRHLQFEADLIFLFIPYGGGKPGGFNAVKVSGVRCLECGEKFRIATTGDLPELDRKGGTLFVEPNGAAIRCAVVPA